MADKKITQLTDLGAGLAKVDLFHVVDDPTVTIDPAGPLEYCQDAIADPLTAIPDGGVGTIYTYEWFRVENPNDISVGTGTTTNATITSVAGIGTAAGTLTVVA